MSIADIATTESARKGGLAKRANADATRRKAAELWAIADGMTADDIPDAAYRYVLGSLAHLSEALPSIKVETPLDAVRVATAADLAFRIARLASGQSTSNVAHANMTDDERRERMAQLRAMGSSETVATATSDTPSPTTK